MFYSNSSQAPPLDITVSVPSTRHITNLVEGMPTICKVYHQGNHHQRPKDLLLSEPSSWSVCINPDVNAAVC